MKYTVETTKVGNKYTVRVNGVALIEGASKKECDKLIKDIQKGLFDEFIKMFCNEDLWL
jgi:hypothetical protein